MKRSPPDTQTLAAIDWMVRLDPDRKTEADLLAFQHWLEADPRHPIAWQRVSGFLQQPARDLAQLDQGHPGQLRAFQQALLEPASVPRRRMLRSFSLLLIGGAGAGAIAHRLTPLEGLLADHSTATAKRQVLTLSDGSRLTLNARTSIDIRFDPQQRRVHLREGSVLAEIVQDGQRPFSVVTEQGRVQTLKAQVLVHQDPQRTRVAVHGYQVEIRTHYGAQDRLNIGAFAWFDAQQIQAEKSNLYTRTGWSQGYLDVQDEPLGDVIKALRPYRRGLLRISPQAAAISVWGTFPLKDTDQVLRSLAETLPIRVTDYGVWVTLIERV